MKLVELIFTLIKIAAILAFILGVGGALTWNDRRMSAMIQDRVGPNRARFVLPASLARLLFAAPPLLLGAVVAWWGFGTQLPDTPAGAARATERILITFELSTLIVWVGLSLLTAWAVRHGPSNRLETWLRDSVRDPRKPFYAGLIVHVLLFAALLFVRGTDLAASLKPHLLVGGPALLAALLAVSAVASASKVPQEGFKLRLIGLLHTAADGLKMIFKEDFVPKHGDRVVHAVAPMIAMFPALVVFTVIPFGDVLCFGADASSWTGLGSVLALVSRDGVCSDVSTVSLPMQIASLDVGILFIFALAGTGVLGAALGGWASDNKYSLLGALRAAGQMVSYEVTLGLTLIGLFVITSTLRLEDIVRWQGENAWGIFVQPVAFLLFFAAAVAETKRIPFDLPEGESEIVGYFTEYAGMKFGMFFFAEYIEVVTSSALMVTLFFGGWQLPFVHRDGLTIAIGDATLLQYQMSHLAVVLLGVVAFFTKVLAFAWVQVVIRWTLPRFRYDQLMRLCWRTLLPLSFANILATGVIVLAAENLSPVMKNALDVAADLSQLVVGLAMLVGVVATARWLLRPVERKTYVLSTSAEFVTKQGKTSTAPMQA